MQPLKHRLARRRIGPFTLTLTACAGGSRVADHAHGFGKISLLLAGEATEVC